MTTTALALRPLPRRAATLAAVAAAAAVLLVGLLPARTAASVAPAPLTDGASLAAPSAATIRLTPVANGLSSPVLITSAHDGTGRLFIVEQTGAIRVYASGSVQPGSFLSLRGKVAGGSEQGLLGLAFHPNFASNRRLYVNFTNRSGDTVIREYRASASNPDRVEAGSGRTILKVNQPYSNHNGGHLAFGPDGYLYIGLGDGGSGGDPGNRAQDKDRLLGKMLRIDVNGSSGKKHYRIPASNPFVGKPGRNEIWLLGLRNPWRWSFDRATDKLWIGDVGQGRSEEVDKLSPSEKGDNLGWRRVEGYQCYNPSSHCGKSRMEKPVTTYSHSGGRCAVTGGYVYRGSDIPALKGWYLFADYCSGEIWTVPSTAGKHATKIRLANTGANISSFGENGSGELFVVDLGGTIYRIDPA